MQEVLAGITVLGCVLIGLALALITLPGVWFMLLAAALVNWLWTPGILSWWTIGLSAALALLGEIAEVAASAAGSKQFGGTNTGATGSVIGALAGAIFGTFAIPVPILGTIIGAIAGAAVGALAFERALKNRSWAESGRSAGGAAAGRAVATIVKLGLAAFIGLLLLLGVLVPGL
jgi:uncharacterized protein YqgC (DUF456 family)